MQDVSPAAAASKALRRAGCRLALFVAHHSSDYAQCFGRRWRSRSTWLVFDRYDEALPLRPRFNLMPGALDYF